MIGIAHLTFAQSAQAPTPETSRLAGYSSQSSKIERDWEKKLQAGIVPENLRQNMQRLSARPHHVGSPYDKDNADWILSKFKEWGFDAHIETFQVLFPTPKERIVEMIEPTKFRAKLQEPAVPGDPTSNQIAEQLPTYNAYSIDGDVTAPLVYVQRGSVMDTDYPGDPLTPGVGATADAKRLDIKDAKTITKIPVLPISWGDALPLLSALQGPVAPEGWRGALPITYHVGPGPAKVHLKVASNWDLKPVNDVIATMRGSDAPEEWVIRGNHYDAWVNGADDPISGMVTVLEEARVLGELHKQGWNPKRTIILD